MKKLICFVGLLQVLISASSESFAHVEDVVSRSGFLSLKVTPSADKKSVNFQECKDSTKPCIPIGSKKYYTFEELREQRQAEGWEVAGTIGADLVLAVCLYITGGWVGGLAIFSEGAFLFWGTAFTKAQLIGMLLGVSTAIIIEMVVDALNPYEQYLQYQSVSEANITQLITVATDEEVMEIIDRIKIVLQKIDDKTVN